MKKGFTLIELLVVITILAVLAGAALPYIQAYVEESRVARARADLQEIARALAIYETREGEYTATDVSQLTGRYLNKAPIDPWGMPYFVHTTAGIVYSRGPSRLHEPNPDLPGAGDRNADNISAPYQAPLALVSASWLDRNNSGQVDGQAPPDQVQLAFSRRLDWTSGPVAGVGGRDQLNGLVRLTLDGTSPAALVNLFADDLRYISASRTIVLTVRPLGTSPAFIPGQGDITVATPAPVGGARGLRDLFRTICLSNQVVRIQPR